MLLVYNRFWKHISHQFEQHGGMFKTLTSHKTITAKVINSNTKGTFLQNSFNSAPPNLTKPGFKHLVKKFPINLA
jgi:hypothetical protein